MTAKAELRVSVYDIEGCQEARLEQHRFKRGCKTADEISDILTFICRRFQQRGSLVRSRLDQIFMPLHFVFWAGGKTKRTQWMPSPLDEDADHAGTQDRVRKRSPCNWKSKQNSGSFPWLPKQNKRIFPKASHYAAKHYSMRFLNIPQTIALFKVNSVTYSYWNIPPKFHTM